jgi:hypothetical protein
VGRRLHAAFPTANLFVFDWYGSDALPHLEALLSERAAGGKAAALLKTLCIRGDRTARPGARRRAGRRAMAACLDERRFALPRTLATMDRC